MLVRSTLSAYKCNPNAYKCNSNVAWIVCAVQVPPLQKFRGLIDVFLACLLVFAMTCCWLLRLTYKILAFKVDLQGVEVVS